ncbi:MAG: methionine adenosyltransferase [Sedimentisphaerales bacterium]|nr:methionine adenosyltransferase [Sedimentisphaerales bacterium]
MTTKKVSNSAEKYLFTSESVTTGHPDKVADRISDAVLDACLAQDTKSRVACETLVKNDMVVVAGEITTRALIDIPAIIRQTIKEIGYDDPEVGFHYENCAVMVSIGRQSPDISQGVTEGAGLHKEQGAGDQGLMFGFACRETPELMPMPIQLAHAITTRLEQMRQTKKMPWLRPDGKSQVTVEYHNRKPVRIHTVVVAAQHSPKIGHKQLQREIIEKVVKPVLPKKLVDKNTIYHINATGRFVVGGPAGDCGLTGRKIIVDTYGGRGRHGGGCFSGKDPTKVDRTASYMARYIAKNIVAAGLADACEIQLSYVIGYADPLSVLVDTKGTGKISEAKLSEIIRRIFPLTPKGMITHLKLARPIYSKTSYGGHFGRNLPEFTWEKTDTADKLRKAAGIK